MAKRCAKCSEPFTGSTVARCAPPGSQQPLNATQPSPASGGAMAATSRSIAIPALVKLTGVGVDAPGFAQARRVDMVDQPRRHGVACCEGQVEQDEPHAVGLDRRARGRLAVELAQPPAERRRVERRDLPPLGDSIRHRHPRDAAGALRVFATASS